MFATDSQSGKTKNIKMKVTVSLVKHLAQEHLLTDYWYFLKFKHCYGKSIYYNYTVNKVSRSNSISHNSAKRRLNTFLSRGWCYLQNGHLRFVNMWQLCEIEKVKAKRYINVEINLTKLETGKLQLQRLLLEDNLRKQEYIIGIKQDLINPTNLKAYKSARRRAKVLGIQPGETADPPMISVNGMASLYHCSNTTAQRIKDRFRKFRWFDFVKQISILATQVTTKAFKKYFSPYFNKSVFHFKGIVFRSTPSRILRVAPE
jgi:hypothetical protein